MKYMIIEDANHNYYIINDEDNAHIYSGTIILATCEKAEYAKMLVSAINNS